MTLKRFLLLSLCFIGGIILSARQRTPQLGGTFQGIPYEVTGDPDAAWVVHISVGVPGTSGNWRTIRLYGEGRALLEAIWPAKEAHTWLAFETEPPDPLWYTQYGIQGVVRAVGPSSVGIL